jgi:hypothetical protein
MTSELIGEVIPDPYRPGETWTIVAVEANPRTGEIFVTTEWSNVDFSPPTSQGTLWPGSVIWRALDAQYHS